MTDFGGQHQNKDQNGQNFEQLECNSNNLNSLQLQFTVLNNQSSIKNELQEFECQQIKQNFQINAQNQINQPFSSQSHQNQIVIESRSKFENQDESYEQNIKQEEPFISKQDEIKEQKLMQTEIKCLFDQQSNHSSDQYKNQRQIKQNKNKKMPKTKNFLLFLKDKHFKYLKITLGQQKYKQLLKDPILQQIKSKFGISMKDFEDWYGLQSCRPYFQQMFEQSSFLEHQLMTSRIDCQKKRSLYLSKLQVLKDAFINKKFVCLNFPHQQRLFTKVNRARKRNETKGKNQTQEKSY